MPAVETRGGQIGFMFKLALRVILMPIDYENHCLEQSRFIPWGWGMSPEGYDYQKEDNS